MTTKKYDAVIIGGGHNSLTAEPHRSFLWALILAEIAPDRTDAVLARGWEFGQSRAVCNVHWQSDVTQGRVVGAALVARLHANEEFRADLESAREEIEAIRAKEMPQSRDCEAEARALAVK